MSEARWLQAGRWSRDDVTFPVSPPGQEEALRSQSVGTDVVLEPD